jgi:hypothetical protein
MHHDRFGLPDNRHEFSRPNAQGNIVQRLYPVFAVPEYPAVSYIR